MGSGITNILLSDGTALRKKVDWDTNLSIEYWNEAVKLMNKQESMTDFILRIRKPYKLSIVTAVKFNSNNLITSISTLYPERSCLNILFVFHRSRRCLLITGSKTLNDYKYFGVSFDKGKVPLLLTTDKFEPLNLYPV
jgi:hypothetical protein